MAKSMKGKKVPRKVAKTVKKGKSSKAKEESKLGQACSMSGPLWNAWRGHVLKHSTWLYVVITLTHALCLRVTEALSLRRCHFNFSKKFVTIPALKRQPQARLCCDVEVSAAFYLWFL